MFLCAHLMSCVYFFVGYGDPHGWIVADSWMAENLAADPDYLAFAWISAFYWAIATMTTIGYGDISASTEAERSVKRSLLFLSLSSLSLSPLPPAPLSVSLSHTSHTATRCIVLGVCTQHKNRGCRGEI